MEDGSLSEFNICISEQTMHCIGDERYAINGATINRDPYTFPHKISGLINRDHWLAINVLVTNKDLKDESGSVLSYLKVVESFKNAGYEIAEVLIDKTYSKRASEWNKSDYISNVQYYLSEGEIVVANFLLRQIKNNSR